MAELPRCTYWAVPCRTCGGMIALAIVAEDTEGKAIDPSPTPDSFEADCTLCKSRKPYAKYEVTLWEGPLPAPGFRDNPAF